VRVKVFVRAHVRVQHLVRGAVQGRGAAPCRGVHVGTREEEELEKDEDEELEEEDEDEELEEEEGDRPLSSSVTRDLSRITGFLLKRPVFVP
jgi:ribosomal protein L12E/L44/L45/RPP1/RPP2